MVIEKAISMPGFLGLEIVNKDNILPGAKGKRRLPIEKCSPQFKELSGLEWVIYFTLMTIQGRFHILLRSCRNLWRDIAQRRPLPPQKLPSLPGAFATPPH
jgi:hypothetical protein